MKAKGQKADFAELEHQPIKGLYQNKDKSGQVRYYYFYRGDERVSATADLTTALERFFTQQQPQPILKLNQLKLSDCLDKYLDLRRDKQLNDVYKRHVKTNYNNFINIINKTYVHEVTFSDLQQYNDKMYQTARQKSRPDLFVNSNFASIRAIFKAVTKKEEHKDDLNKLIDNLKVLDYSKIKHPEPKSITKEQFNELLPKTKGLTRLMLLLGLNCAYTSIDVVSLRKSDINFDTKTIQRRRHKTSIVQCCYLWDETIDALKQTLKDKPNPTDYLLISQTGLPYKAEAAQDWWQSLKVDIKHKTLRSTFRTVATRLEQNEHKIRFIMGHHSQGVVDNYLCKRAEDTKPVTTAVHNYFFNK